MPETSLSMGDDQDATIWSAVAASLEDKDRLCPVLAGVGWLQGDRLQLQLADGDLNVVAPSRLLQRVLKSCNGQSSFNDIVAQAKPEAREELASFLDFLLVRGALVDAINLAERLAGFGFQTSPIGQSAPEDLTDRLRTRKSAAFSAPPLRGARIGATPLDEFFAARRSASTFDDAAISGMRGFGQRQV
jgi:ribosomal protein S12 methylthiotransferase accessory factor